MYVKTNVLHTPLTVLTPLWGGVLTVLTPLWGGVLTVLAYIYVYRWLEFHIL